MRTLNVVVILTETDPRSVDLQYRLCKQLELSLFCIQNRNLFLNKDYSNMALFWKYFIL